MRYRELNNKNEIKTVIDELKVTYRDLSKILISSERDTTGRGAQVITLFYNLDPVMKLEGEKDMLDLFITKLEEEQQGY
ncbi:MAG: hypothetical protein K9M94_04345 [Spirochaetia bacterium]|nr:hypothetical protein [Spirochaetia bacterium]